MKRCVTLSLIIFLLASVMATAVFVGPIIKPRKYRGPIPRSSFSLTAGFLGEATNAEMYDYFDTRVPDPSRSETVDNDFGNAWRIEGTYTYKLHPQVAVRGNVSVSFLKSDWTGKIVPRIAPPDSSGPGWIGPVTDSETNLDVDLFVVEASALYFFVDAATKEFQPYIGGGFSIGIPHQKFEELQTVTSVDRAPNWQGSGDYEPYYDLGQIYKQHEEDKWSMEAGVHGILGALYYITNTMAITIEGRGQMIQSKFPLDIPNEDYEPEEVDFIVDFTGFALTAGISYSF